MSVVFWVGNRGVVLISVEVVWDLSGNFLGLKRGLLRGSQGVFGLPALGPVKGFLGISKKTIPDSWGLKPRFLRASGVCLGWRRRSHFNFSGIAWVLFWGSFRFGGNIFAGRSAPGCPGLTGRGSCGLLVVH